MRIRLCLFVFGDRACDFDRLFGRNAVGEEVAVEEEYECDHTFDACRRFKNTDRFGGFPIISVEDIS